jgi:hypothetical protein
MSPSTVNTQAGNRLTDYLEAVAEALRETMLFRNVRVHLDVFDLDQVKADGFQAPAARILFGRARPIERPDTGLDLALSLVVVIVTQRTGRPAPDVASADVAATGLMMAVAECIQRDPYFGRARVGRARITDMKVGLSETSSKEGIAIALVEVGATLLSVAGPSDVFADLAATPGLTPGLTRDGLPVDTGAP